MTNPLAPQTPCTADFDSAPITCDESAAAVIRQSMTVEQISAERQALTDASKARFTEGNRTGLSEPTGHYMAGDAFGFQALEWMTTAERTRFHRLALALPTSAEEREAAKLRIEARVAARKAKRAAGAAVEFA